VAQWSDEGVTGWGDAGEYCEECGEGFSGRDGGWRWMTVWVTM